MCSIRDRVEITLHTNPAFKTRICIQFTKARYEPHHEKTGFLHMRKQRHRSAAQSISAFVFAIQIVQFLYYQKPKFQASSHLLWLYRPVCVGPGRKPRRPVFSQRGSYGIRPVERKDTKLNSYKNVRGELQRRNQQVILQIYHDL